MTHRISMLSFPNPTDASVAGRAYWASQGGLHSIIAAIFNYEPALHSRIDGKATVLSDGQVFSSVLFNLTDGEPTLIEREFLGNWETISDAVEKLATHLQFSEDDRLTLREALADWVQIDYSGKVGLC